MRFRCLSQYFYINLTTAEILDAKVKFKFSEIAFCFSSSAFSVLLTESQGNSTPARKESTKLYRDDIGGMPYIGLKWELEKVNAISENLN